MARPRTPTHLKPVPTTISMSRRNRVWLEERGLTSLSGYVNRLIEDRIKQEEALQEGRVAHDRVQRLQNDLLLKTDDATSEAATHLAEHATTNRLAAMLLARLQSGAMDLNPTIGDALAGFVVNETTEPEVQLDPEPDRCIARTIKGERCKRKAVNGGTLCAQHDDGRRA